MNTHRDSSKMKITLGLLAGYVGVLAITRHWYLQWGSSATEQAQALPGDEFMGHAAANHAITIYAPVKAVWPWLVQIGQDRAGFYSYTFLENMVAADMHNANQLVPEWQHLKKGDSVRLGSEKVYGDISLLPVVALEDHHYFVLKGWGAFVLRAIDENTSRLIIRSHAQKKEGLIKVLFRFLVFDPIHFIMERKMLLGIKKRAEGTYHGKSMNGSGKSSGLLESSPD